MSAAPTPPKRGPHRLRRALAGLNVFAAGALAALLFAMVNLVAAHFPVRFNVSDAKMYVLTEKTRRVLAEINADVEIHVVYSPSHESYERVRALLTEYEYAARHVPSTLNLVVRYVDPDRDLALMKELRRHTGLVERSVVLCRSGSRSRVVADADLYDLFPGTADIAAFRGEIAISSALHSIVQKEQPVLYTLLGHGERDLGSHEEIAGYSRIGRMLERDNIEVRPLALAMTQGVPVDADAILIAGPTRRFAAAEVNALRDYLDRGGRVCALIDPFVDSGLDELLADWGLRLGSDYVVDAISFNMGRDFFVASFGAHFITHELRNIAVGMSMPRSVEAMTDAAGGTASTDRPRVTVLARSSDESWGERNPAEHRPTFDPRQDRRGPIGMAAAVEKGVRSVDMGLAPSKLVVIGDSDLVANKAMTSGLGGNVDFFMGAINWLIDREELVAIGPRLLHGFTLRLDQQSMRWLVLALTAGAPGIVALFGILIWATRRR